MPAARSRRKKQQRLRTLDQMSTSCGKTASPKHLHAHAPIQHHPVEKSKKQIHHHVPSYRWQRGLIQWCCCSRKLVSALHAKLRRCICTVRGRVEVVDPAANPAWFASSERISGKQRTQTTPPGLPTPGTARGHVQLPMIRLGPRTARSRVPLLMIRQGPRTARGRDIAQRVLAGKIKILILESLKVPAVQHKTLTLKAVTSATRVASCFHLPAVLLI